MARDVLQALLTLPRAAEASEPADWLDAGEQARLATISADVRRRQFIGGHWLARKLACEQFGGSLAEWCWHVESGGKPYLLRAGHRVEIAVSHSADVIACAVAAEPIGLDLEIIQRERDWLALARHVLSEMESDTIAALSSSEQGAAFTERWALHEAWGKREGEGVLPSRMRRLQFVESEPQVSALRSWTLPHGCLALAVPAAAHIECRGLEQVSTPRFWRCLQV